MAGWEIHIPPFCRLVTIRHCGSVWGWAGDVNVSDALLVEAHQKQLNPLHKTVVVNNLTA